jgi:RNA polymerase sigma factor (sigma-70 family)
MAHLAAEIGPLLTHFGLISIALIGMNQPPQPSAPSACASGAADSSGWFASEVYVHDPQLKSYLRGSFPSVQDVDDVVQESYLRVWRARMLRPIGSAKSFLFTVARNVALKVLRKNSNAPFVPAFEITELVMGEEIPSGADAACVQERIDLLADAVMTLPARCREIVILHKLQGVPQREVAARLGLSERTVERQVRLGVKRCLVYFRRRGFAGGVEHER